MSISQGQFVLVQGRYFGTVRQSVPVQNEHGYSFAYLVRYQREVEPREGWFLARDVVARAGLFALASGLESTQGSGYLISFNG